MLILRLLILIQRLRLIQRLLLILRMRLRLRLLILMLPLSKILGKPIFIAKEALFGNENRVAPLDFPIFLDESLHRIKIV